MIVSQKSLWSIVVISVVPICGDSDRIAIEFAVLWDDISQSNIRCVTISKFDDGIAIFVHPTKYYLVIMRDGYIFQILAIVVWTEPSPD